MKPYTVSVYAERHSVRTSESSEDTLSPSHLFPNLFTLSSHPLCHLEINVPLNTQAACTVIIGLLSPAHADHFNKKQSDSLVLLFSRLFIFLSSSSIHFQFITKYRGPKAHPSQKKVSSPFKSFFLYIFFSSLFSFFFILL